MINNRDLSWLCFNERVLQEAQDPSVSLLQRLRFLGIFSNNQDEFVKVRLANIVRATQIRGKKQLKFSGDYTPNALLPLVNSRVLESQKRFAKTYESVLTEMHEKGISVVNETQLDDEQREFCRNYFFSVISPRLVPLIVRKSTKLPFLLDSRIYHAVKMNLDKRHGTRYAIIEIPVSKSCPRFIELPTKDDSTNIIYIDDIIRLCLNDIFFMFDYTDISAYTFKFTRDAFFSLDDDISKSLIEKMEEGLENRLHGRPVRLVYDQKMPEDLLSLITSKLHLHGNDVKEASGRYHSKRDLMQFPKVRSSLEYNNPEALQHPDIKSFSSILEVIRQKDILLNYPYHTFSHFIDFMREAAIDPKVESIFITLYRTAEHSKVINTLINAAKNGKQVVVLLELFARFDEEQNVENAEMLQKAGIKVIYGGNGLKVHSKLVLVERKERGILKGYAYVGTGNFNESTARLYSDFGLFTYNQQIANDARTVFDFLLNTHKHFSCKHLIVAPYYMRERFSEMIEREIKNAKKGNKAYIYAKFNSLTDEEMILSLYKASQAGVEVKLIIRGACCLQPQQKEVSNNIQAISIVDKYLEHSRLIIFHNGGNEQAYIGSADWMTRNLDRRVEVAVPILDKSIKETLKSFFDIQWSDNVKARNLKDFGDNNYVEKKHKDKAVRSQTVLYDFYKNMNYNKKK